jgi:hypothetical protein
MLKSRQGCFGASAGGLKGGDVGTLAGIEGVMGTEGVVGTEGEVLTVVEKVVGLEAGGGGLRLGEDGGGMVTVVRGIIVEFELGDKKTTLAGIIGSARRERAAREELRSRSESRW